VHGLAFHQKIFLTLVRSHLPGSGYKQCHAEAAINENLISALKADSQGCPTGKDATLTYFHDTVEAVKAGDAYARVFYVESAFYVDGRQILAYSESDRSTHQHDAPRLHPTRARTWRLARRNVAFVKASEKHERYLGHG
jgi:hypothetical protein